MNGNMLQLYVKIIVLLSYIDGQQLGSEEWTNGTINSTDIALGLIRRSLRQLDNEYFS